MIWQDIVFMIGGFIFSIALVPSILGENKPARLSCAITGIILAVYCVLYATLGLWLAFSSGMLTSLAWFILLIQRRR